MWCALKKIFMLFFLFFWISFGCHVVQAKSEWVVELFNQTYAQGEMNEKKGFFFGKPIVKLSIGRETQMNCSETDYDPIFPSIPTRLPNDLWELQLIPLFEQSKPKRVVCLFGLIPILPTAIHIISFDWLPFLLLSITFVSDPLELDMVIIHNKKKMAHLALNMFWPWFNHVDILPLFSLFKSLQTNQKSKTQNLGDTERCQHL